MIKVYLGRFLQSGLLLMLNLVVSIFASTLLFTSLKAVGLSDKGSLLVAFFVLVGLIILGFLLYPKSVPQLREAYRPSILLRWLLSEHKGAKKAEEVAKGLEQLSQTLLTHEVFLAQLIRDANYAGSSSIASERLTAVMDNLTKVVVRERESLTASQSQLINQFADQLQVFSENVVRESQKIADSQIQLLNKLTSHFERQEVQLETYEAQLGRFQERLAEVLTHYDRSEAELQERIGHLERIFIAKSYRDRGINLLRLNRHVEALPAFRLATQLDPNDGVAYRELGVTLLDLKRHEEALPAFQQAIEIDPNDEIAHRELGVTLLDLKRHEEALPHFNLATQLAPNDAVAFRELGITLLDLKRHQQALPAFQQAIKIAPNDAVAHRDLGITLLDLKQHEEALPHFKLATQLDPNDGVAYRELGITLLDLKRYQEAISAFDKAIDINPRDTVAHNSRAIAFDQLVTTNEAQQPYLAAAQKASPQLDPSTGPSTSSTISAKDLPSVDTILRNAYLDAVQGRVGDWVLVSRLGLSLRRLYPDFKATDFASDLTSLLKQNDDSFEIAKRPNGHPQVRLKSS